jgi:hypothetical protein
MPGLLRELSPPQRPRVGLAGLLAGLVASVIGLGTVTGIELIGGKTLSSMIWSCPERIPARKSHPVARVSILGGRPSGEQPVAPGNEQQVPGEPNRQPAGPGAGGGAGQDPAGCEPLAARRRARDGRSRATRQRLREGTRCKTGERQRKRGPGLVPVLFSLVKGDGQPLDPQRDLGTLLCIPLHGPCAARRLARWV